MKVQGKVVRSDLEGGLWLFEGRRLEALSGRSPCAQRLRRQCRRGTTGGLQRVPVAEHARKSRALESLEPGSLRLKTTEATYSSKTAIIAAGIGAFQPNRLNVAGAQEFEGKGVSYVVREREKFLGKKLLIVGGGDTALDWSLELRNWASEVTLIHRFDYFEAHQRSVLALYDSQVSVHTQAELVRVSGNGLAEAASNFLGRVSFLP